MAAEIRKCDYVVIPVASLAEVLKAWGTVPEKLNKLQGWVPYCAPGRLRVRDTPLLRVLPA